MAYLLAKIIFLLLLAALGGALLMYWWVRRRYEDATLDFTELQMSKQKVEATLDEITGRYSTLVETLGDKVDAISRKVQPLEHGIKDSEANVNTKLADLALQVGKIESAIQQLPQPKPVDMSAVLEAIDAIVIPAEKDIDLAPVLESIKSIQSSKPEAVDLTPVLAAIDALNIPPATDLSPIIDTISLIRIPETNLTPVLEAIAALEHSHKIDLTPVMLAIDEIAVPRCSPINIEPLAQQVGHLAEQVEQLSPPTKELAIPEPDSVKNSEHSEQVIAQRIGSEGNRLRAAVFGQPDDLKRINGVGSKLENLLHSIGVYYYWQVADWAARDIQKVDDLLIFKGRIERDNWVPQAQKLAQQPGVASRPSS